MVEGVLLPDGTVLWINGANRGAQGFLLATDPTLRPLLYDPKKAKGSRWAQLAASKIPRLYHSVALLLLDGTVLVAGSGPNEMPVLNPTPNNPYVTEFRVERFTPPYLQGSKASLRPTSLQVPATVNANGGSFTVSFAVPATAKSIRIALYHGGFVTHSVHMGHRMLFLDVAGWKAGQAKQTLTVKAPQNLNVAPPGPYVIYAVVGSLSPFLIAHRSLLTTVPPRPTASPPWVSSSGLPEPNEAPAPASSGAAQTSDSPVPKPPVLVFLSFSLPFASFI